MIPAKTRLYPATLRDYSGIYHTFIENDGDSLFMELPGAKLVAGSDIECWEMQDEAPNAAPYHWDPYNQLVFEHLDIEIPLDIWRKDEAPIPVVFSLALVKGIHHETDRYLYQVKVMAGDDCLFPATEFDDLERLLDEVYKALNPYGHLKTCYTCVWSDTEPSNSGMTASYCFVEADRDRYLDIMTDTNLSPKNRFWTAQSQVRPQTVVQSIWHCPRFEHRRGIGYNSA